MSSVSTTQAPPTTSATNQQVPHNHNPKPQIDITREEFDRFKEALKKEEFRKLLIDYIEEIKDPENRKRYEDEVKQFEAERGVDVTFINPQPGFVIKTSQNGEQKCFINCAKSEHVAKPTNQISIDSSTGARGLTWSIPMAQAPPRDDLDNKQTLCRVYDVIFHPDALYLSERNNAFHKCLVDTALDAVEREYLVKLDRVNLKFPKLQFKGVAQPIVIRKLSKNPSAECQEPHPLNEIYPPMPTESSAEPKVLPMTKPHEKQPEYCTPKYTLKYRRNIDLTEFTNELDAKLNVTMPLELVVDIELPLLNSSNDCQLDVTEKSLFLVSNRIGAKYRLDIQLPYVVKDKEGSARFDVDTRHMLITLPVVQAPVEQQRKMHQTLLQLSREDSGVESDVREDIHSSNTSDYSPIEEFNTLSVEESLQTVMDKEGQRDQKEEEAVSSSNEDAFLKSNIDYQFPNKVDSNVLDQTLSLVLHTRNVQEDSIEIKQHKNYLHMKFLSIGTGYYPAHYAFYFQLAEQDHQVNALQIEKAEAEAWENNVILNIHFNKNVEQLETYLAGIDGSCNGLQEFIVQEHYKVAHKSRQRQNNTTDFIKLPKTVEPQVDISIERSDCEKSVEIEIKSRINENSTGNANTTEDDEDDDAFVQSGSADGQQQQQQQQQNQKKVNKKQKRKNKKRRSLSESACDDIKAYQQHQQEQHFKNSASTKQQDNNATEKANEADDDDDEDSSPERLEKSKAKTQMPTASSSVSVPFSGSNFSKKRNQQRSFSESRDSVISCSAGSSSYKGILKHYSRYEPRPSISDSCSSIEEFSLSAYSTSVDGLMSSALNSLRFSQSFSDIPEENVVGLSESCKKTVRFSEVIKKQVFRMDSSILGQRKKNQKRRERKQKSLQRRLSEGDSADYEDNKPMAPLQVGTSANNSNIAAQYLKTKNSETKETTTTTTNNKRNKAEKKLNKIRSRLESESSSDVDNHKNAMMFEMDM